jgi:hypothetical protein
MTYIAQIHWVYGLEVSIFKKIQQSRFRSEKFYSSHLELRMTDGTLKPKNSEYCKTSFEYNIRVQSSHGLGYNSTQQKDII